MKAPNIICVTQVVKNASQAQAGVREGDETRWVPARALGHDSLGHRLKAAWLVFTGRADALTYPGQ